MPSCSPGGADKDTEQKSYSLVGNQMHWFDVESECYVFYTPSIDIRQLFLQLPETIVVVPMKDRHSDAGPSTTTTYPKESLSPRTDTDPTTGELSSSNWVVDGSGFLSPAGPVLKEVLDLVDGVSICSNWPLHCEADIVPMVDITNLVWGKNIFSDTRTLKVGAI